MNVISAMNVIWIEFDTARHCFMNRNLYIDGQQCHQYQQNDQPSLISNYWIRRRPRHMALKIQVIARDMDNTEVELYRWIRPLPSDNLTSKDNTDIKLTKNPSEIRFNSKRPHTLTKMNVNINMDSASDVCMYMYDYIY
jgi:hypothetical protein